jgi:hypothetical protein
MFDKDRNPVTANIRHERMVAWACVNAILAYLGEDEVLYGEWNSATYTEYSGIDPVAMANRIRTWRRTI